MDKLKVVVAVARHRKNREFPDQIGNVVDHDAFLWSSTKNSTRFDDSPLQTSLLKMLFNFGLLSDVRERRVKRGLGVRGEYYLLDSCFFCTVDE